MEHVLLLNLTYETAQDHQLEEAVTLSVSARWSDRAVGSHGPLGEFTIKLPSGGTSSPGWSGDSRPFAFPGRTFTPGPLPLPVLRDRFPTETSPTSCSPQVPGGRNPLEKHRYLLCERNRKKGGRTPATGSHEAHQDLVPAGLGPALRITITVHKIPESWRDYLYWNVELVE